MKVEYKIDEEGNVFSSRRKLKSSLSSSGYLVFSAGRGKTKSVHREVAIRFIPNPNNLPEVNHKDGDKLNNHVDNLEWTTRAGNAKHSCDIGLQKTGEQSHLAKLSKSDVGLIRALLKAGLSQAEIAREFFVTRYNIWSIAHSKSWSRD